MNQQFEKTTMAMSSQPITVASAHQGSVQRVDTVGREIIVLLPTGLAVFDVPCDCSILLRGEPVKLRVIQPGDQVQIAFSDRQGMRVATGFGCSAGFRFLVLSTVVHRYCRGRWQFLAVAVG